MLRIFLFFLIVVLCFSLDQISKYLIESLLSNKEEINVLPFLSFVSVHNQGFLFGLGSENHSLFKEVFYLYIPLFILLLVLIWAWKEKKLIALISAGFLIGGGLGNLWDRIFYGYVRDCIDFHIDGWHFPAFNLADVFLNFGIFLMLVYFFYDRNFKEGRTSFKNY